MSEGLQGIQVHLVDNSETAAEFMRWAGERRPLDAIGLDTETGELPGEPSNGALSPWHGDLRLVQIGDGMQGWSIPWLEWKGVFYEWAKQHTGPIVTHNVAFEAKFFDIRSTWKMPWHQMHDTMIMAHIIDPLGSGALKTLASKFVDPKAGHLQRVLDEEFATNGWTWGTVPVDFQPYWCVPTDTEILTRSGWKKHSEVLAGDETLGYVNGDLVWTAIEHVQTFDDAPLVRVGNTRWSTECTSNHRWLYQSRERRKGEPEGRSQVKIAPLNEIQQQSHNRLVLTGYGPSGDSDITSDEARVIAWLITDGHVRWQRARSSPIPHIFQSEHKYHNEVRDLLHRVGAYVSEKVTSTNEATGNVNISFYVQATYVTNLWNKAGLHDQPLPQFVMSLSREARSAWLDTVVLADGTTRGPKARLPRTEVTKAFGTMHDAIVLAAYLEGHLPTSRARGDGSAIVGFGSEKRLTFQKGRPVSAGRGAVWCPTTALGTWTARDRDGRVFVTGNSYGALDPIITMRLFEQFYPLCGPEGRYHEVYELEMATRKIVTRMEINGARVDLDYCRIKRDELLAYTEQVKEWVKTKYGYSATSNVQLAKLFEDLGAASTERTPSGAKSMSKDQLKRFVIDGSPEVQALANAVLSQRKADKLATTYFENFLTMNDDGILHPSVKTVGARTGRMSITDPALQTLPSGDSTVRRAFIPRDPGNVIITSDLDQVEFRLVAALSGDPQLIGMFARVDAEGGDAFTDIMREVYQDPTLTKADPRRKLIKGSFYGRMYGAGIAKQALTAGIPEDQMRAIVNAFDRAYPGVKQLQMAIEDVGMRRFNAEGQGYVLTKTGRRMPCDDGKIYALVNYLIQSSAAEIFKANLVKLDQADLTEMLIVPVHDEIVLECPRDQADEIMPIVRECMTTREGWAVPLTADVSGPFDNWGEHYD